MQRKRQGKVGAAKSEVVARLPLACSDELCAAEFIEHLRWGEHPACPKCGDVNVYTMKDRATGARSKRFLWRCRGCGSQFTCRTGTVLEESLIPLRHWCYAYWAACSSKKGISAKQIQRQTGLSYKSALFLMHRVRFSMTPDPLPPPLKGDVEADETYIGGRVKRPARIPGVPRAPRKWSDEKVQVVAMVERGGQVRAEIAQSVMGRNIRAIVLENVDRGARLMTDEHAAYRRLGKMFADHQTVTHSEHEYKRGDASTNTIESYFALIKRGMYGTFHAVSRHHLHRYIDEFSFRWNTRQMDDGERTRAAFRGGEGKRLYYHPPCAGAA